jgi:hypothetical protein
MRRLLLAATVLAAVVSCKEAKKPAAQPVALSVRDLARAYAVDAQGARLSLAAAEIESRLATSDAKGRAAAREVVAALDVARAELARAVEATGSVWDRALLDRLDAKAKAYAARLSDAAAAGAGVPAELAIARDEFSHTFMAFRAARALRPVALPDPQGAERDFAEARRDMEKAESAFTSRTRVAPREEGHELDVSAVRMTGQMAVERARAAIPRLAETLREPAARYAAAQERVLDAVSRMRDAADGQRAAIARGYQAAKADALSALADYFAALATR